MWAVFAATSAMPPCSRQAPLVAIAEQQSSYLDAIMLCARAAARSARVWDTSRVAHDGKRVWALGEGDLVRVRAVVPQQVVDAEHAYHLPGCQSRMLVQARRRNSLACSNCHHQRLGWAATHRSAVHHTYSSHGTCCRSLMLASTERQHHQSHGRDAAGSASTSCERCVECSSTGSRCVKATGAALAPRIHSNALRLQVAPVGQFPACT